MIPRWYSCTASVAVHCGCRGQPVDRQVDLDAGAVAAVGIDCAEEPLGQVGRVAQRQKRVLGIGVREHRRRLDHLAGLQLDAGRGAAVGEHAGDRRLGADLGARLARGVGHHPRHLADAAGNEAPSADAAPGVLCGVVVQQHVRRAGRARAGDAVVDRVPAERRLQVIGLEPLVQVLRDRRCEQVADLEQRTAVAERATAQLAHPQQVAWVHGRRVGRGGVEQRADGGGQLAQPGLERRQATGVTGREPPRLLDRAVELVVQQERRPVGEQVEAGAGGGDGQAALGEPHVLPDALAQHAQHIGAGRRAEARRELLGDAGATHDRPPLEHERAHPRASQVERRHQAVVAAADDHGVVGGRAHDSSWRIFDSR